MTFVVVRVSKPVLSYVQAEFAGSVRTEFREGFNALVVHGVLIGRNRGFLKAMSVLGAANAVLPLKWFDLACKRVRKQYSYAPCFYVSRKE